MNTHTKRRLERLQERLADLDSLVVALSGGVDSALLLAEAVDALGPDNVLAVTIYGPVHTEEEITLAGLLAKQCKVEHIVIEIDHYDDPRIMNNAPERCYACKLEVFSRLLALAKERGFQHVASGSSASDSLEYRPGARAELELGVLRPLRDANLTKTDIRAIAKKRRLPVWNKPSNPCLATRFPYNTELTGEKLEMVEQAERIINRYSHSACRCRIHGNLARIEIPKGRFHYILLQREGMINELKSLGLTHITLDLQGIRTGGMDE